MVNGLSAREYGGSMGQETQTFLDEPPFSETITTYDRTHMKLYMRLVDANRDGADWREAVHILFGLDPDQDPRRCRSIHDAHLARARWMMERGYRELVRESQRGSPS
ncbi:DUF2285 domain-containing protein [Agrobacterium tumefaciens]|jgi:hypothetical protein|uniref:DNA -binding domain-containing protein n=1 Tax=Rhizobium oryzihabitans TaxID=2267833 RepID=UPI0028977744|nr:DUF2285 domain-containing protein [Brucella anthropi]WKL22216.1 DUF2285 domain-containing protein [Agrobacterium tumefaciens]